MWKGVCFAPYVEGWSVAEFKRRWNLGQSGSAGSGTWLKQFNAEVPVDVTPYFRISVFEHAANPLPNSGLLDNPCWPILLAPNDPGFALFRGDP